MSEFDPVAFGEMRAEMTAFRRDVERLVADVADMKETMHKAMGGWRVLLLIGGACAALGSAITWALNHVAIR